MAKYPYFCEVTVG